jgi:hypothetical protein
MFAQAISSTTPATAKSSTSGVRTCASSVLCPRAAGFRASPARRNSSISFSVSPSWSGASTPLTIGA